MSASQGHTISMCMVVLAMMMMMLMTSSTVSACPGSCNMCSSREIWCGAAGLTTFPGDFPQNITLLYLVNNNISYIRNQDLKGFQSTLLSLYLLNNKLNYESLESGGFQMLKKLQTLELNSNLFTSIRPNMFAGMTDLVHLQIKYNRISRIYPGAFANLPNLTDLQLSGNRIVSLPQIEGLPKLNRLCLEGNRIRKLQYSFRKLKMLMRLSLANNSLDELSGEQFAKDNKIKYIWLSSNNFKEVPPAIRDFANLRALYLNGNPISSLPNDLMNYSSDFNLLDVRDCQLREVGPNFIPEALIFNNILISGNPWKCDCGIKHLVHFTSSNANSFGDISKARCSEPLSKRGLSIKGLDISDMNCKSETRISQSTKTSMNDCSTLVCANGGTCVKRTTGEATCRCTADWRGETCIEPNHLPSRNSTRKSHGIPEIDDMEDSLVLEEGSITTKSVTIIVPQLRSEYLIRVLEIINDRGDMLERQKYKIKPESRNYVVRDLASGATYRVCLGAVTGPNEMMCSTVRTTVKLSTSPPPTEISIMIDNTKGERPEMIDPVPVDPHIPQTSDVDIKPPHRPLPDPILPILDTDGRNTRNKNHVPETGESLANFDTDVVESEAVQDQSVYLLIGAGIGAFVILVFGAMIFVFLRNKRRKLRSSSDSAGGSSDDTRRYTDIGDTEMTPLAIDNGVSYQHRTTPSPPNAMYYKQHAPNSRIISYQPGTVTNNAGEVYQLTDAGSCRTGAGSPNRNGSLGRSSISGGSVGGILSASGQPLNLYEQQHNRGYSPLTNNTAGTGNSVIGEPMDDIQYVAVSGRGGPGSYTTGSPLPISHPVQQRAGVPQQINMYRDMEQRVRNPSEMSRQSPMVSPDPTYPARPPGSIRASTTSINQFHTPPIVVSRINNQTYTPGMGPMIHTNLPQQQQQQQPQRSSRQSYSGVIQVPASPCFLTDNYNRGGVLMPKVRGME